jgi:indolepyruvate ferredoxin oxidoreductase alpha subunit
MKVILSGNEAIARGFYEAGGKIAAAYPGTPSTEVVETLSTEYKDKGVYAEWSVNEKVALEVAIGGSLSGVRSMACMKHVGVNVAADPLLTVSYTGVNGGLVLMVADDPGMFSSQNEQDSRHYARFAKIPCIEPSSSQEAKDFLKLAFEISENFDTPVLFRSTTRISHCKGVVTLEETKKIEGKGLQRDVQKYVMLPVNAQKRHVIVEERLKKLKEFAETTILNVWEKGSDKIGIIANGISYQYAKEAFPEASILKLGMTWPLPEKMIKDFAKSVKKLIVIEELDPFIEDSVKALGVKVHIGKNKLPLCGEYSKNIVYEAVTGKKIKRKEPITGLTKRPPTFCPGCSHRGLYTVLSKLKPFVSGDIGCYTLGALPPYSSMHSCICMGASISGAHGISKGLSAQNIKDKPVAIIGDSTFIHSGITGLINMVYNNGDAIVVIMNNDTTGMTGGQEHPGTGITAMGVQTVKLNIEKLCQLIGAKRVIEIDTYNLKELERIFREEMEKEGPSVLISNQPCVLRYRISKEPLKVNKEKCTACKMCLKVGCIALTFVEKAGAKYTEIDPLLCNGCTVCQQMCKFDAIVGGGK